MECPTCGSDTVPPLVEPAMEEIEALSLRDRHAVRELLCGMYLYTTKGMERGMIGMVWSVLCVLAPKTEEVVREHGWDTMWAFYAAEYEHDDD